MQGIFDKTNNCISAYIILNPALLPRPLQLLSRHKYQHTFALRLILAPVKGQLDTGRTEIAQQIDLINNYNPKVIAIDAFFERPSPNDSVFRQTISSKNNIVFLNCNTDNGIEPNIFYNDTDRCGYANFIGNKYSVIRAFYPRLNFNGHRHDAFAACIAHIADNKKYEALQNRNNKQEIINYKGNLETYTNLSADELMQYQLSGQLENVIKDKIVLLGFFSKDTARPVMEDLHYTPLNAVVSGKSYPDMYGVVIHANILSMIFKRPISNACLRVYFAHICLFAHHGFLLL